MTKGIDNMSKRTRSFFLLAIFGMISISSFSVFSSDLGLKQAGSQTNKVVPDEMTSNSKKPVWIDVRSDFEYKINNIEGDVHIPHKSILEKVSVAYPDKTTEINLYCLSGSRSKKAKYILTAAGYTKVNNSGGISDVRKLRNLVDKK